MSRPMDTGDSNGGRTPAPRWLTRLPVLIVGLFVLLALTDLVIYPLLLRGMPHPECPHRIDIAGVTQVSIAGPITDVPEFHDCQRLVINGSYGPVAGIWVSYRIDSLLVNTLNARTQDSLNIILPNLAVVERPRRFDQVPGILRGHPAVRGRLMPVVQIYNYGAEFSISNSLKVGPQFSCVYLEIRDVLPVIQPQPRTANPGEPDTAGGGAGVAGIPRDTSQSAGPVLPADSEPLTPGVSTADIGQGYFVVAWLESLGQRNECHDARTSSAGMTQLPLQVHQPGGVAAFSEADYPPVARWEWDDTLRQHFIGVKCAAAMCRIGQPDFKPRGYGAELAQAAESGAGGPPDSRIAHISGWYDEQLLARRLRSRTWRDTWRVQAVRYSKIARVLGLQPPAALVAPSTLRGVIFPDPQLVDRTRAEYANDWVRVAEVWLSEPDPEYEQKFNFVAQADGRAAILYLHDRGKNERDDWIMAIRSKNGVIYKRVIYRKTLLGTGFKNPGTVRWRWLEEDESTWEACPEGCCETGGPGDGSGAPPPPPWP